MKKIAPKKLAKRIIKLIWQKKADDIALLNLKKVSNIADYFVICSVSSGVQARVVADVVVEDLKKNGLTPNVEGYRSPSWPLTNSSG
ncbi:RsfS/YbeB/iojap family protein, partial [bacterium]|nr:RsfS/YbeB/iojap family protein [bacterium]